MKSIALPPGTKIGHYKILGEGIKGGFGVTYVSFDDNLKRPVMLKECFPTDICYRTEDGRICVMNPSLEEFYLKAKADMQSEARKLAKLKHPNIVRVYDVFESNGTLFYVMDRLDGSSLREVMAEAAAGERSLSPEQLRDWLCHILSALGYMHTKGMLHRDIKPDNIVFDERDKPVLIDFGAAAFYQENTLTQGQFSPAYASPEQVSAEKVGPQTDLYSLAATWYELLCGKAPAPSIARLYQDKLLPLQPLPELPQLPASIMHNLALRPEERSESAAAWWDELMTAPVPEPPPPVVAEPPVPSLPEVPPDKPRRKKKRGGLPKGCLPSMIVGGCVLMFLLVLPVAYQDVAEAMSSSDKKQAPAPTAAPASAESTVSQEEQFQSFYEEFCRFNQVEQVYRDYKQAHEDYDKLSKEYEVEVERLRREIEKDMEGLEEMEKSAYISMVARPKVDAFEESMSKSFDDVCEKSSSNWHRIMSMTENPLRYCPDNLKSQMNADWEFKLRALLSERYPTDGVVGPETLYELHSLRMKLYM
ncbi:MAG: serine/threonine-protein kinase [Akkermansia sp.]|nr:serine/threonine-protein kinase [Akkermansia sp.]